MYSDFHPGGLDAMWASGHFGFVDGEQPDPGDTIPDQPNDPIPEPPPEPEDPDA